jgi:hypothetical protein
VTHVTGSNINIVFVFQEVPFTGELPVPVDVGLAIEIDGETLPYSNKYVQFQVSKENISLTNCKV